jgi:hypothetical protein
MNNEPVAWAYIKDGEFWDAIHPDEHAQKEGSYTIPLYTHPVSQYKAITNTKIEPTVVSYTHPVKELTDEELIEFIESWEGLVVTKRTMEMLRAILRKAQEK